MTSTSILRKVDLYLSQALPDSSFFDARIELTLLKEDGGAFYLTETVSLATNCCSASQNAEKAYDDYTEARKAFLNEFNLYTEAGYQMV